MSARLAMLVLLFALCAGQASARVVQLFILGDSRSCCGDRWAEQYTGVGPTSPYPPTGGGTLDAFLFPQYPPSNANIIARNLAISGTRVSDWQTRLSTRLSAYLPTQLRNPTSFVAPRRRHAASRPADIVCAVVVELGSNPDATDGTVEATRLGTLTRSIAALPCVKAVLVVTIPDRGDGIIADFNAYRTTLNSQICDPTWQATNHVKGCIDTRGLGVMAAGAYSDSSLFKTDRVHETPLGASQEVAPAVRAINAMVAALQ